MKPKTLRSKKNKSKLNSKSKNKSNSKSKNNQNIEEIINNENTYYKKKIPKKVKEEVWLSNFGKRYQSKCYIKWCSNRVNVFNFHVGHDVPESKGGSSEDINNLKPICDRCNLSMGHQNTIQEWNKKYIKKKHFNLYKSFIYVVFIGGILYYNKLFLINYIKNYNL